MRQIMSRVEYEVARPPEAREQGKQEEPEHHPLELEEDWTMILIWKKGSAPRVLPAEVEALQRACREWGNCYVLQYTPPTEEGRHTQLPKPFVGMPGALRLPAQQGMPTICTVRPQGDTPWRIPDDDDGLPPYIAAADGGGPSKAKPLDELSNTTNILSGPDQMAPLHVHLTKDRWGMYGFTLQDQRVRHVVPASDAAVAGVRPGFCIVKVNNSDITSPAEASAALAAADAAFTAGFDTRVGRLASCAVVTRGTDSTKASNPRRAWGHTLPPGNSSQHGEALGGLNNLRLARRTGRRIVWLIFDSEEGSWRRLQRDQLLEATTLRRKPPAGPRAPNAPGEGSDSEEDEVEDEEEGEMNHQGEQDAAQEAEELNEGQGDEGSPQSRDQEDEVCELCEFCGRAEAAVQGGL
eukprot:gene5603-2730_t